MEITLLMILSFPGFTRHGPTKHGISRPTLRKKTVCEFFSNYSSIVLYKNQGISEKPSRIFAKIYKMFIAFLYSSNKYFLETKAEI